MSDNSILIALMSETEDTISNWKKVHMQGILWASGTRMQVLILAATAAIVQYISSVLLFVTKYMEKGTTEARRFSHTSQQNFSHVKNLRGTGEKNIFHVWEILLRRVRNFAATCEKFQPSAGRRFSKLCGGSFLPVEPKTDTDAEVMPKTETETTRYRWKTLCCECSTIIINNLKF